MINGFYLSLNILFAIKSDFSTEPPPPEPKIAIPQAKLSNSSMVFMIIDGFHSFIGLFRFETIGFGKEKIISWVYLFKD